MKAINSASFVDILHASRPQEKAPYYLFYSSLWDGYVTDPALMVVPFDDHVVHRGDGVFESMKCESGAVYNLDAHLQRLWRSAHAMGLLLPGGQARVREKILEALKYAGQANCAVRVVVSRGPGSMGVAPGETVGSALYILVYALGAAFSARKPAGGTLRRSHVPVKHPTFATVKTCNYIANALMSAEAKQWGVDFVVGVDETGHITEGCVENIGMVSKSGRLVFPELSNILAGTTMLRVAELARELEARALLKGVVFRSIREEELYEAREIFAVGTTLNVAPIISYEGQTVGDGKPGVIAQLLNDLLVRDILENPMMRTPYL